MIRGKREYKILLAIDPEEGRPRITLVDLKRLKKLLKSIEITLEAVRVFGPQQHLKESHLGLENYHLLSNKAGVIYARSNSMNEKVAAIADYAKNFDFDLILMNSHGRTGIDHLLQGSYTESLIDVASVPVLVLGKKVEYTLASRSILFPTDFSEHSKSTFRSLLKQIQTLPMNIVLLHSSLIQNYNYDYGLIVLAGSLPNPYWEEHRFELQAIARDWMEEAEKCGIACKLVVDEASQSALESIVSSAREHELSMIALSSHHPNDLLRGLIQLQFFQLWVLGPKAWVRNFEVSDFEIDRTLSTKNFCSLQQEDLR